MSREAKKRSTPVGFPMTASPSPSLINSISLSIVAAPQHFKLSVQYGAFQRQLQVRRTPAGTDNVADRTNETE